MKISINYLKQYLDFELPEINELASIIGSRLGALEEMPLNLSDIYKSVIIVKVVDCEPIEGTDHLNLCLIDDGRKASNVERNEQGLVQVVCGAPNVKSAIMAAWLPPGTVLPASYNHDPLTLEARIIRGQKSNGMLASPKELSLSEDHDGILIIDSKASPGDSFMELYELNDYVIDIENKMFTHRPDCFGLLGVAREVSGILSQPFKSPGYYLEHPKIDNSNQTITVNNEIPSKVPRFSIFLIDNIEIQPSPLFIQSYLSRMGIRPINNIVDLTNLVMIETGQPLHAYDYNKLKLLSGDELSFTVRLPKPEETLTLLNGKKIIPTPESIGIAVKDTLVGLGGVMGGQNSEVDDQTTSIVLEAACFDMYDIRRTSMELGIFSESVTRFTKGQSPLQTVRVLSYALNKIKELLPNSQVASGITDDIHLPEDVISRDSIHPSIKVSEHFINSRLGTSLSTQQIAELLQNVECKVEVNSDNITVTAPFWRTDLEIREDIVEEVGRLYGYDNIKPINLTRIISATPENKNLAVKAELRMLLSEGGANELLTYSLVSKRLLESADQSTDKAFEIANAISPELMYYRLSILPSLLEKVFANIKAGYDDFALFEIGSYHKNDLFNKNDPDLPEEYSSLALAYSSRHSKSSAAYFKAKYFLTYLLEKMYIQGPSFTQLNRVDKLEPSLIELAKPFEVSRSAVVSLSDNQWGIVGEFKDSVLSKLKLPKYSAGFEVKTDLFLTKPRQIYRQLSKYPSVKQDITLNIPEGTSFADLFAFLRQTLTDLAPKHSIHILTPVGIYRPKETDTKNYTFHLDIADYDRTFQDQEINDLLDRLADQAKDKFKAKRI